CPLFVTVCPVTLADALLLTMILPWLVNEDPPLIESEPTPMSARMVPLFSRLSPMENDPLMLEKLPPPAAEVWIVRLGPRPRAVVVPLFCAVSELRARRIVALSSVCDPRSVRLALEPVRLISPGPLPPTPVTVSPPVTARLADVSLRSSGPW